MSTQPSAFTWDTDSWFVRKHDRLFEALRRATFFIDPAAYRGISRTPLSPFPSADPELIAALSTNADGGEVNYQARTRFREILEPISSDSDDDEDLLPTLLDAAAVYQLLEVKADYEIVVLRQQPFDPQLHTLGFDVGYWGGDRFSLIGDTVVMPTWHPPDPQDFDELAQQLRDLNQHVLFPSAGEAAQFRAYYMSKPWAETESYPGQFCIIQVGVPDVS